MKDATFAEALIERLQATVNVLQTRAENMEKALVELRKIEQRYLLLRENGVEYNEEWYDGEHLDRKLDQELDAIWADEHEYQEENRFGYRNRFKTLQDLDGSN